MKVRRDLIVVVHGIRMIKDAAMARAVGGRLVGVVRGDLDPEDLDPTEREVHYVVHNMCHGVIDNNGSLNSLRSKALAELDKCPQIPTDSFDLGVNMDDVEYLVTKHEALLKDST